jgi:FkbM family methyltransferase
MHILERFCRNLRNSRALKNEDWLWNRLRAPYTLVLATVAKGGLERVINGTDTIRLTTEHRAVSEIYEPESWKLIMHEARSGDVVADVGANIGLYTIALAKRVGEAGTIHAFEPDPANFLALQRHCRLNKVTAVVVAYQVAVGWTNGRIAFEGGLGPESHVGSGTVLSEVEVVRLDSLFRKGRIDILKIDVEGAEEDVLRGASLLLNDRRRGPRSIYIEVHPFAWKRFGTTSETLLNLLVQHGYRIEDVSGEAIASLKRYGEIIARRQEC